MTDNAMLEKCARAMEARRNELIAQPLARIYPQLAEAVIRALMEPTPQMVNSGEAIMDMILPEGFDNTPERRRREFAGGFAYALRSIIEDEKRPSKKEMDEFFAALSALVPPEPRP